MCSWWVASSMRLLLASQMKELLAECVPGGLRLLWGCWWPIRRQSCLLDVFPFRCWDPFCHRVKLAYFLSTEQVAQTGPQLSSQLLKLISDGSEIIIYDPLFFFRIYTRSGCVELVKFWSVFVIWAVTVAIITSVLDNWNSFRQILTLVLRHIKL